MKPAVKHTLNILRRTIGYGLLVSFVSIASIAIYVLNQRPDLDVWHEVELDEEFTERSDLTDFKSYLELEKRLFKQLDDEVYAKTAAGGKKTINRYQRGSMMDPTKWPTDWNRSFVWDHDEPQAGVLLIHGMSDSPYSLRHFGKTLHDKGASVIGLRVPGHGTAPSGLVETTWKDMAAAVRLAAKDLKQRIGDKPLFLIGYSNGGGLAVIYALETLEDASLPRPDGLILLSPEIGISKAASLAVWQGRVGHWLGLEKLAWNDISIEYDPFKYGSFAVNAGDQAYRVTLEIEKQMVRMEKAGKLGDFPSLLAFQSGVDATVTAPALVSRVFARLPKKGHELVLFDINRVEVVEHLLAKDPADDFVPLLEGPDHPFSISVLTNVSVDGNATPQVEIRHRKAGQSKVVVTPTELKWPNDTFSLSHVALPFPESDRLYGSGIGEDGEVVTTLGNLALRGERNTLKIGPGAMLRQKWNPFYPLLEARTLEFCLGADSND